MVRIVDRPFRTQLGLVVLTGMVVVGAPGPALAQIFVASGANPAAIAPTVDAFRAVLGADNGAGGSYQVGRREVSWEEVPDDLASPATFPFNFYNTTVAKGLLLNSITNLAIQHPFRASARLGNPSGTPVLFGDINAAYPANFQTFSGNRIMAARQANDITITFVVPGTSIPATVSAFGAVFLDIDLIGSHIEAYTPDGTKVMGLAIMPAPSGLTFVGFSLTNERIAQVVISVGNTFLGPGNADSVGVVDVAALDDFIYNEPRAMAQGTVDFDGDAGTDITIYRPSTGQWFIVRSGGLPAVAVKWGEAGDIPVAGDYDGDRISDIAIFRPSSGTWFIAHSSGIAPRVLNWGQNGDIPVPGDYDKDGKTDIAIYRPSTGQHFLIRSSNGSQAVVQWGQPGDIPVSGRGPF